MTAASRSTSGSGVIEKLIDASQPHDGDLPGAAAIRGEYLKLAGKLLPLLGVIHTGYVLHLQNAETASAMNELGEFEKLIADFMAEGEGSEKSKSANNPPTISMESFAATVREIQGVFSSALESAINSDHPVSPDTMMLESFLKATRTTQSDPAEVAEIKKEYQRHLSNLYVILASLVQTQAAQLSMMRALEEKIPRLPVSVSVRGTDGGKTPIEAIGSEKLVATSGSVVDQAAEGISALLKRLHGSTRSS